MTGLLGLAAHDGTTLRLRRFPPSGPKEGTVVLVHGWGDHQGRLEDLGERLTTRGFRVWSFDLRGHGRSDGRRGDLEAFQQLVGDLALVTEHACSVDGVGRASIVAHSLGGLVMLRALQEKAIVPAACVASAPWLATAAPIPGWKLLLARLLENTFPHIPISNRLDPTTLTSDPHRIEAYRADPLVHGAMTPRMFREVRNAQASLVGWNGTMPAPALFLVPEEDPLVDSEATREFVARVGTADTRLIEIPSCAHDVFNEVDRGARFDEVGEFFAKALASSRVDDQGAAKTNASVAGSSRTDNEPKAMAENEITDERVPDEPEAEAVEGATAPPTEDADAVGFTDDAPSTVDGESGVDGSSPVGEVESLRAERDRLRDQHLRLAADFDNFRKRVEGDLRLRWDRAQAELVSKILEPLDDLQRVAAWEPETTSVEAIVEGVDLVERKFFRVIEEVGVEVVDPTGERFDPNTMEAMMRVPTDSEADDEMVQQVFQKGYTLKGQLVRPARVSVFKAE